MAKVYKVTANFTKIFKVIAENSEEAENKVFNIIDSDLSNLGIFLIEVHEEDTSEDE